MKTFDNRFIKYIGKRIKIYVNYYDKPLYRKWYFKHAPRLIRFKDKHKGQDCFIIGNGPSLKSMDLSPLRNYHTFGLNKIYLLFDKVDLDLSYHAAVNNLVIEQSAREFERLTCPSFLSFKNANNLIQSYEHIYYLFTGSTHTFHRNIIEKIWDGATVTYVAMQIAFYMGFERIFLVGVDHSFRASGAPNEKQFMKGEDQNHFDPNYFGNKEWQVPNLEASELAYHLAGYFFNRDGRRIYDATVNGKLEIFPKISYEEALNMCTRKTS
jgi:hypothetical protein